MVQALSEENYEKAKRYISTSYFIIGTIVILLIIVGFIIFPHVNWNDFFNIDQNIINKGVMLHTVQIIFIGLLCQFLLKIISSILYAIQKSALPNFLTLVSTVIQLVYVLLTKGGTMEQNLVNLAYINVLSVNVPLFITTIIVFCTKLKKCKPNIKYFDRKLGQEVLTLSGVFFWVQIVYMLIMNTNEILITQFTSSDKVVEYQIYNKLFTIVGTFFNIALTPIWSAVTKAFAEGKKDWIFKLYKKIKFYALIGTVCEFVFIFFIQLAVNIWLRDKAIQINYLYAFIFALFGSTFILNSAYSSIANGLGRLKIQTIFYTLGIIIKIPIILLCNLFFNDWINVVIATIIIMIPFLIAQNNDLNKELIKETS